MNWTTLVANALVPLASVISSAAVAIWTKRIDARNKAEDRRHERVLDFEKRAADDKKAVLKSLTWWCSWPAAAPEISPDPTIASTGDTSPQSDFGGAPIAGLINIASATDCSAASMISSPLDRSIPQNARRPVAPGNSLDLGLGPPHCLRGTPTPS